MIRQLLHKLQQYQTRVFESAILALSLSIWWYIMSGLAQFQWFTINALILAQRADLVYFLANLSSRYLPARNS